jgi:hypothetical protein
MDAADIRPTYAADTATEPAIRPTLAWGITQLVPSPEIAAGGGAARFGVRWQLTPVLYSWGMNRKLSPWRFFVVEPLTRQSGSIELYFTPEYLFYGRTLGEGLIARTGIRSYFPLLERGDYLSVSVGASHVYFDGKNGAAVEGGVYALYGTVGVEVTYSPSIEPAEWIATLRIRYF